MVAAAKGYQLILTMPESMSSDCMTLVQAYDFGERYLNTELFANLRQAEISHLSTLKPPKMEILAS